MQVQRPWYPSKPLGATSTKPSICVWRQHSEPEGCLAHASFRSTLFFFRSRPSLHEYWPLELPCVILAVEWRGSLVPFTSDSRVLSCKNTYHMLRSLALVIRWHGKDPCAGFFSRRQFPIARAHFSVSIEREASSTIRI